MNKYDSEILEYLKNNKSSYKELCLIFSENECNTKGRIHALLKEKYITFSSDFYSNNEKPIKIYSITDKGKKYLQDIQLEQRQKKKEKAETWILEFMRSFFFPLIVALITAYMTAKCSK